MILLLRDILCKFFLLIVVIISAWADAQDFLNNEGKEFHLPETKFSFNEYSEYPDNVERETGPQAPPWALLPQSNYKKQLQHGGIIANEEPAQHVETIDPNIEWDSQWASDLKLGQVSAVSLDPNGNIAVFHRGNRIWGQETFNNENKFDPRNGPIEQNTIVLLDKSGKILLEWGKNMFYLPHGLTIDSLGNYWITDVALHQVFKFNAHDIELHWDDLKREQYNMQSSMVDLHDTTALFKNSILKPSLILGEAFEPGNDEKRFCKPTAVAVQPNGDFFVSDGYCNSRVIKFNEKGERILQWGRRWGIEESSYVKNPPPNAFFIPHALALASDLNYIFVADRENGRVLCFFATNGTFHKEYKHSTIGTKIYSVAYNREQIYLINGPDPFAKITNIRGFILNINSNSIVSQFAPKRNMSRPHDIAVNGDGSEIYVVELDYHKIYKFYRRTNEPNKNRNSTHFSSHHKTAPLTDMNSEDSSTTSGKTTTATLVLSLVTVAVVFIAICVTIAAVISRCQKRGCLLTMRKRMRWEAERKENFKLSSLLENRRGKGFKLLNKRPNKRDFSKLNTEPETSDDERPENSFTKMI